jgi:hypothetical protein
MKSHSNSCTLDDIREVNGIEDTFWSMVDCWASDECWPWLKTVDNGGYGHISIKTRIGHMDALAHRVAYMLSKGEIPSRQVVMHSCDNPVCCNPNHLAVGSYRDNALDCTNKGRRKITIARTPRKYSDDDVRTMRELANSGVSRADIMRRYEIYYVYLSNIITGKQRLGAGGPISGSSRNVSNSTRSLTDSQIRDAAMYRVSRTMTVKQIAKHFGVHPVTIYALTRDLVREMLQEDDSAPLVN